MTEPYEYDDAETVDVTPAPPGDPVDPPDPHRTVYASVVARREERRPIVPAALRSAEQRRVLARWAVRYGAHTATYHATRSPKYLAKVAFWAPIGVFRGLWRVLHWAFDLEQWSIRQDSVRRNDVDAYLKLARQRDERVRRRLWVLLPALAVLVVGVLLLCTLAPLWARWVVLVTALPPLAWLGRPADRAILDRVVVRAAYRKLTAELVRTALLATGHGKAPEDYAFPREIVRDGPGYSALVDLPHGVTAGMVMDRRDRAAGALRLPLDQVWIRPGRHAGQVELWVADEPISAMRQPAWPLLKTGRADLFKPLPLGVDERGQAVTVLLMFTNLVIGAIPRMGKTFVLRLVLLAACLDPRTEVWAADLKGTGDLGMMRPVLRRYFVGDDDDEIAALLAALTALTDELRRRAKVIRDLPRDICPESKVTPELAANKTLGLHPIVVGIDECQVAFTHDEHGKTYEKLCTDLIKRGPALGIILVLATQRPDAKSLPTGISGNAGMRFCLRVMGQQENDMVLGTSMYRNGIRATQFTAADKGIGWLVGALDEPAVVRTSYVDAPAAERVVARALQLRRAAGTPTEEAPRERVPVYNLLADVRAVWVDGEAALWSELIVPRLAQLRPDVYGEWTVATFGAAMKAAGVATVQIHRKLDGGKGATRYGVRLAELEHAIGPAKSRPAIDD